jgi:hypothetical protein
VADIDHEDDELLIADLVQDPVVPALIRRTPGLPLTSITPGGLGSAANSSMQVATRRRTGGSSAVRCLRARRSRMIS